MNSKGVNPDRKDSKIGWNEINTIESNDINELESLQTSDDSDKNVGTQCLKTFNESIKLFKMLESFVKENKVEQA